MKIVLKFILKWQNIYEQNFNTQQLLFIYKVKNIYINQIVFWMKIVSFYFNICTICLHERCHPRSDVFFVPEVSLTEHLRKYSFNFSTVEAVKLVFSSPLND